jgi:predicted Zn-ribbon and HTH transcriptional regulator
MNAGQWSDYRSAMNREGDIAIGARARAYRRNRYLVGAAGLALIGGAVVMHLLLRLPERAGPSRASAVVLVQCMECGYQGLIQIPPHEARFPVKCPRCKRQSCQKVWECRDCGHRFVPHGELGELRCPKCDSQRVGTATTIGGAVARE